MKLNKTTLALSAVAVAVALVISARALDTRPSGVQAVVGTDYVTSGEHAKAIAYEVVRDFNQCLRAIPGSTLWNPSAYEIEYGSCCDELWFGNSLATDVNYGLATSLDRYHNAACPEDDGSASAPPPETRRTARIDALMAMPD